MKHHMDIDEASKFTSEILAKLRTGEEAQEEMKSFLEKRKTSWIPVKKN